MSQNDHATIFFCAGAGHYLLCYDEDLENLPAPTKSRMPAGRIKPFQLVPYRADRLEKTWALRVVYKPVETTRGRRPDDMVDAFVLVTRKWIDKMGWQFDSAFPAGLDDDKLLQATNVEILY